MPGLETNLRAAHAPTPPPAPGAPAEAVRLARAGSAGPQARRERGEGPGPTLCIHIVLLVFAAAALLPFVWMICASFKTGEDLFAYTFLPWDGLERLTLENYRRLFARQPFRQWMFNSLFLSSAYTAIVVTLSSLGGFALAKYHFAGKGALMGVMLATMMLPPQVLVIANYELMYSIGWIDTYRAILVPTAVSVFGMFLFKQAMSGVPDELLQAGRVDGCSELRLWWEVALPVVRPMIGAFTLLSFLGAWTWYLWPSIVLQDEAKYTLTIGLANLLALPEYRAEYGVLMAGTLLGVLPVVALFFVLQKDFIAGLMSGAVKG